MAFTQKQEDSRLEGGFQMPQSPPMQSNALVEMPTNHQMNGRKPETSKLTIMGQLCFKALQIIDGTRPKINTQNSPPTEIGNASTTIVRLPMDSCNPSVIMDNPSVNINGYPRSVSAQQVENRCMKSTKSTSTATTFMKGIKRLNASNKPIRVSYDDFYNTLMQLDEPVLDDILKVIQKSRERKMAKKKASKKSFQQRRFSNVCTHDSDDSDSSDDCDDADDESLPAQSSIAKKAKAKAKGRPAKKIDYAHSTGFKNFFKNYKTRNSNKPHAEVLQCAKVAYKNLSSSSRSRYRNLKRAKAAEAARRIAKRYSDSESN